MIRALRFSTGQAARSVAPRDLPGQPGGGIWCDASQEDLDAPAAGGLQPWLDALRPLTAQRLRQAHPRQLASAQPGFVHVRLPVLESGLPPTAVTTHERFRPPVAELARTPVEIIAGEGFLLTLTATRLPALEQTFAAYAAAEAQADGPDFALYRLLVATLATVFAAADRLVMAGESVDQRLTHLAEGQILREVVVVRQQALQLRGLLAPARDGLRLLHAAGQAGTIATATRPYLEDLARATEARLDAIESVRAGMGEAVEAYTSVQSTEMNRVMRIFTVLTVVLAPPMLVASIYGMNFAIPEYHWVYGYSWALGLMLASSFLLWAYFHVRRWL